MAEKDELDLAVEAKKPSGKRKLIILIAAIMLVTTGVFLGVLYFMGMLNLGSDKAKTDSKPETKQEQAVEVKPAFYLSLDPAFVVNFEDQSHASYLQVEMQVMARSQDVLNVVKQNMPVIRNNILFILSAQKYEEVRTNAGKVQLQKAILDAIRKVIDEDSKHSQTNEDDKKDGDKAATKELPNVEQVYFTSFIMQ